MAKVLVTGGSGYIGSHTCVELIAAGHSVIVLDNFSNSTPDVVSRMEALSGQNIPVVFANILETEKVRAALRDHQCDAVIHFAGLKAVGESMQMPLSYYRENVAGAISLLEAMQAERVHKIIFSSSATVYGIPEFLPYTEEHPLSAVNPYGRSKLMIENILRDFFASAPEMCIAILRYFNPCGAHHSGMIGENPKGHPNNLMPFIAQVASAQRPFLTVFGDDYETPDGTGVRDYIHVVDLAKGHVAALDLLAKGPACHAVNLGTGEGYSVLDMLRAFSKATGSDIPYKVVERRAGDIDSFHADTKLAQSLLGWQAELGVEKMCEDHWNWQINLRDGKI